MRGRALRDVVGVFSLVAYSFCWKGFYSCCVSGRCGVSVVSKKTQTVLFSDHWVVPLLLTTTYCIIYVTSQHPTTLVTLYMTALATENDP